MFKKFALTVLFTSLVMLPAMCTEVQESTISTEASINREIAPDTARIRFYVENTGINLADLKQKNDKIVNDAITSIKSLLNQDEQIKTIAFNVSNIYSYKDKIRVFQKYQVTNGFEVKLKDLDKISQIINIGMDKGIKRIGGVNFSVENTEAVCNEMMAEAIQVGKARVEYLSKSAGSTLDKVKSINPYCSLSSSHVAQNRVMKSYMANASMDSMAEGAALETIEPGTINARANVSLVYYLK